jgi:hypothetical protein
LTARFSHSFLRPRTGIAILLLVSCTRPSGQQTLAEPNRGGSSFAVNPSVLPDSDRHVASESVSVHPSALNRVGCAGSVDVNLLPEAWITSAAQACHPGATKIGQLTSQTLDPSSPTTFDIPSSAGVTCFSAYAIVAEILLPLVVEVVDDQNNAQVFGTIKTVRAAIPEAGPFCPLQGGARQLRFHSEPTAARTSGSVTLAFFARQ